MLTTFSAVLDGGTGFLKVGYAAQVCLTRASARIILLTRGGAELPGTSIPLYCGAANITVRGESWRYRGEGYNVRR